MIQKNFKEQSEFIEWEILRIMGMPDFKFIPKNKHTPVTLTKDEWHEINDLVYKDYLWRRERKAGDSRWAWKLVRYYFWVTILKPDNFSESNNQGPEEES